MKERDINFWEKKGISGPSLMHPKKKHVDDPPADRGDITQITVLQLQLSQSHYYTIWTMTLLYCWATLPPGPNKFMTRLSQFKLPENTPWKHGQQRFFFARGGRRENEERNDHIMNIHDHTILYSITIRLLSSEEDVLRFLLQLSFFLCSFSIVKTPAHHQSRMDFHFRNSSSSSAFKYTA